MLDARWNRLLHYLRKGLADAGAGASLEVDDLHHVVRIPIAGTGQSWRSTVADDDILLGDLTTEADYLLRTYRIACAKAHAGAILGAAIPTDP